VQRSAAAAALPVELAVYIAVEAERALAEAIAATGVPHDALVTFLDIAARDGDERGLKHVLARPLADYADALRRGLPERATPRPLRVRVPHRVAASWANAAAAAGTPFEHWLINAVARAQGGRVSWEAAAARAGRSLSEWVLLQAARCARSPSTSPQTIAWG